MKEDMPILLISAKSRQENRLNAIYERLKKKKPAARGCNVTLFSWPISAFISVLMLKNIKKYEVLQ